MYVTCISQQRIWEIRTILVDLAEEHPSLGQSVKGHCTQCVCVAVHMHVWRFRNTCLLQHLTGISNRRVKGQIEGYHES